MSESLINFPIRSVLILITNHKGHILHIYLMKLNHYCTVLFSNNVPIRNYIYIILSMYEPNKNKFVFLLPRNDKEWIYCVV